MHALPCVQSQAQAQIRTGTDGTHDARHLALRSFIVTQTSFGHDPANASVDLELNPSFIIIGGIRIIYPLIDLAAVATAADCRLRNASDTPLSRQF